MKRAKSSGLGSILGDKISTGAYLYNLVNYYALKHLGWLWPLQYIAGPYPGIVPHYNSRTLEGELNAARADRERDEDYLARTGVADFADRHGGLCTLQVGWNICFYSTNTRRIFPEIALKPSTIILRLAYGDFLTSLRVDGEKYQRSRALTQSTFSNAKAVCSEGVKANREQVVHEFLQSKCEQEMDLHSFCVTLVSHTASHVDDLLGLTDKPLSSYFGKGKFAKLMVDFMERVGRVMTTQDSKGIEEILLIKEFAQEVLMDNLASINASTHSFLKAYVFCLLGVEADRDLTADDIKRLPDEDIKAVGVMIVNVFELTSLTLWWVISIIESDPDVKQQLLASFSDELVDGQFSVVELIVLETLRLRNPVPGLVPSVIEGCDLSVANTKIHVPGGAQLWTDRSRASRDREIFSNPGEFDIENIRGLVRSERYDTIAKLLSESNSAFNAFSVANTARCKGSHQNQRKCPARTWSFYMLRDIVTLLYRGYQLQVEGTSMAMHPERAMRVPAVNPVITMTNRPLQAAPAM